VSIKTEVYQILKAYAAKTRNPVIDFENFCGFLERYAEKHTPDLPDTAAALGQGFSAKISGVLQTLEEEKCCRLRQTQNKIHLIHVLSYYNELVEQVYKKILSQGDTAFPSPDFMEVRIDSDIMIPVGIKTNFGAYLEKEPPAIPELLNITFPDIPKTLLVTSRLLEKPLIEASLQKIRLYLRDQKNASYLQHKMLPLYPQREKTLKDLIVNSVTRSDLTLQEFMVPPDQTFQFWTQVSSILLKEYISKTDKLEEEIDLCLAAHIVNFYAVYFKGKAQKARESEASLKILAQRFTQPPYAYTFHDIYNFKDGKGLPIIKRIDHDVFAIYLESCTTPKDNVSLPEILKVKTPDKTEYFIRSDCVVKILLSRIYFISKDCKARFISAWTEFLMLNQKKPEMLEDAKFSKEVENYLKTADPLFNSLLNFNLLFLIRDQITMPPVETDFLNTLLNSRTKTILPADRLLNLSRKQILVEARLRLPLWKIIPVLGWIIDFLTRLFTPKPQKPAAPKNTKEAAPEDEEPEILSSDDENSIQKARYEADIASLISRYIGAEDIQKELTALISLWNPLLDPKSKQNLVEDVNSLVRDFLRQRKYKARLRAPSPDQLEKLAKELSESKTLGAIRDKGHLREYITLYMLRVLHKV
jgi:hypothetical protein